MSSDIGLVIVYTGKGKGKMEADPGAVAGSVSWRDY